MPYVAEFFDNEKQLAFRLRHVKNGAPRALARAANLTMTHANKKITEETRKRYLVRKMDIAKGYKKKRATWSHPTAYLNYTSGFQNLAEWGGNYTATVSPKFVSTWSSHPTMYKGRATKTGGWKSLGHNQDDQDEAKPFRKPGGGSKGNLYVRKTNEYGSSDIRGVAGPAYTQVMKNKDVLDPWREDVHVWFQRKLDHEIDYLMRGK